jgi:hypothetical protein
VIEEKFMILLNKKKKLQIALLTGVSAFAFLVGGISVGSHNLLDLGTHAALAEGSGGGGNGGGGNGGGGNGGGGHDADGGDHGSGGQGGRPDNAGEDSDGKGPKAGQAGKGDGGGKPAWAQEGVPEVELGRLSVARSPSKVLARALDEVLTNWDPATASLYNMSAEAFADYVAANWDTITVVDSPLQNLAMLEALYDGTLNLTDMGITPASTTDLAAIFLGVASDKTVPISTDTVIAINVIMDLGLDSGEIESLATKAEDVREGVLEGHG